MLGPYNISDYPITIVVIPLIYIVVPLLPPCSAYIVTIVPRRSPLLLLLCPYIIIVMSALIM